MPNRPDSTYRALTPFITVAPVRDEPYDRCLPRPYKNFAALLDKYDRDPDAFGKWGVFNPSEFLHDEGSVTVPRTPLMRGTTGMIKPMIIENFQMYSAAMLLYDRIASVAATKLPDGAVLRHPRQEGWYGKTNIISHLEDLNKLLSTFITNSRAPNAFDEKNTSSAGTSDSGVVLAAEMIAAGKAKNFYANVKNMATVAFCISIMLRGQGYMQVPENYEDVEGLASAVTVHLRNVMAKVKRMRSVLLFAVAISPLAVLVPFDLLGSTIDIEHTLLNHRLLGNQRPNSLRKVEDELMRSMLAVAEGRMSAHQALLKFSTWLSEKGGDVDGGARRISLCSGGRSFYEVGEVYENSAGASIYSAWPAEPYARHWHLPPAADKVITDAKESLEIRAAEKAVQAVAEEEARKAEEARKVAEEEVRKAAAEEEARRAAEEEEARKAAEEEGARKAAAEEGARKAAEEEEARRAAEEEARKAAEEEEARKAAEEEEARKAAEEEEARKAAEEEEARRAVEEEEARRAAEEEVRKAAAEEEARKAAEEEEARKAAEEEARKVAEEEARKVAEEGQNSLGDGWEEEEQAAQAAKLLAGELQNKADGETDELESEEDKAARRAAEREKARKAVVQKVQQDAKKKALEEKRKAAAEKEKAAAERKKDKGSQNGGGPRRNLGRGNKISPETVESEDDDSDVEIVGYTHIEKLEGNDWTAFARLASAKLEVPESVIPEPSALAPLMEIEDDDEVPLWYSESQSRRFTVYDASGEQHEHEFRMMLGADWEAFERMFDIQASHYVNGRPAWLTNQPGSLIRCLTHAEFERISDVEIRDMFANQSFVLTNTPGPICNFDSHGANHVVADPFKEVEFQDQSIPVDGDHTVQLRRTTVPAVVTMTERDEDLQKPLNGLSFARHQADVPSAPYTTDVSAVCMTGGFPGCICFITPGLTQFATMSTQGAHSYPHIDAHGECTWVRVLCGYKLWFIAEPISEPGSPSLLESINLWTNPQLDIRNFDFTGWKVEAILLRPGDKLVQRANQLHFVLTLDHAICQGGYFLSMACLRRTISGAVHTLFEGRIATNASHSMFQPRMNAIAAYLYKMIVLEEKHPVFDGVHLPEYWTSEGLETLIIFTCYIELQNIFNPESYRQTADDQLITGLTARGVTLEQAMQDYNINAVPDDVRAQNAFARGRMAAVIDKVFSLITVRDCYGFVQSPYTLLLYPSIGWFMSALYDYHQRSLNISEDSEEGEDSEEEDVDPQVALPSAEVFLRELQFSASHIIREEVHAEYQSLDEAGEELQQLFLPWPKIQVSWTNNPEHIGKLDDDELYSRGCTAGDLAYYGARKFYLQPYLKRKGDWGGVKHEGKTWVTVPELQHVSKKKKVV